MRSDTNQKAIVTALRSVGASVFHLTQVGDGCPDIVVGYHKTNYLLEIKTEKGKLRETQTQFHENWRGTIHVVRSVDDALAAIGAQQARSEKR